MELSIGIVHHHRLLREALVLGLSQNAFPIVHQAHDVEQLVVDMKDVSLDVLLVEACRPLEKYLDCLRRFRRVAPECKVIMLDVPDHDETILACIEIGGISGYVVQEGSFKDLIRTVRAISAGESICSPRLANLAFTRISTLANRFYDVRTSEIDCLTRREQDIMEAIERGLSNKEIASELMIGVSTVKNHVHNILDKLHLQNRRSAARYAKEHGFVARHRSHRS
ncbi:MAG: response regulator transcription factor [Nitrospira sp.]|nr:response regulator transcription factor [Nitrospira sp.]